MLIDLLKQNPTFSSLNQQQQEIFARLAVAMQEDDETVYLSPSELAERTQVGNRDQWTEFLQFDPVRQYINQRVTQITQVAQRKALLSLQKEAKSGNVQAIKEINELSGIMQKKDNNRTIILTRINRPIKKETETNDKN